MNKLIESVKLPRSIKLLGRNFKVKIVSQEYIQKKTDSHNAVGAVNYLEKRILISESLPQDEMVVTFFHECHHAISYITGFNQICDSDVFELSAETFAAGFYDVVCGLLGDWEVDEN